MRIFFIDRSFDPGQSATSRMSFQRNGLGLRLCAATKRLMASCRAATEGPLATAIAGCRPMGHLVRGRLCQRPRHQRRDACWPGPVVQQTVYAVAHEPLLPAPDAGLRHPGPAHRRGGAAPIRGRQDDPRPPDVFLRAVPVRHDRLEPSTIGGAHFDLDPLAHRHERDAAGSTNPPASAYGQPPFQGQPFEALAELVNLIPFKALAGNNRSGFDDWVLLLESRS
jgi:hypothetical protein